MDAHILQPARLRGRPWLTAAAVATACLLAIGLALGVAWTQTPGVADLAQRIRTATGPQAGAPLELSGIAPVMRQAIVAVEDERFYQHDGIDVIGVLRAVPYDIAHLSARQGASTITEQLAKLVYLAGNDHSPWRKLQDAALALKLENRYTKNQILAAYLHVAYFGHGATGITAAAQRYFATTPSRLSLAQASLLAGLVQAPTDDDPFNHPAQARARQLDSLRSMIRNGYATENEATNALDRPLPLAGSRPLPPLHGVTISAGPPFRWDDLALSGILIGLGAIALSRARRPGTAARFVAITVSIAVVVVGLIGAIDSFRVV